MRPNGNQYCITGSQNAFVEMLFQLFFSCNFTNTHKFERRLGTLVSVLWREEGYTVKYSRSPKEIPRAKPKGFPESSGYILAYIPTRVTIQTYSITISKLSFLEDQYWKSWFSVLLLLLFWQLRLYSPVYFQLYWECTVNIPPALLRVYFLVHSQ